MTLRFSSSCGALASGCLIVVLSAASASAGAWAPPSPLPDQPPARSAGGASEPAMAVDVQLLARATYVAFAAEGRGGGLVDVHDLSLPTDDRDALVAVRRLFEKWNRYTIVERREQAEIVVVVKPGRRVLAGGTAGPGSARSAYAAGSSPQSMLLVYDKPARGGAGSLLWRGLQTRETAEPWTPLFEQFRTAVERAPKQR